MSLFKNEKSEKKLVLRHLRHRLRSEKWHLIWIQISGQIRFFFFRSVVRSGLFGFRPGLFASDQKSGTWSEFRSVVRSGLFASDQVFSFQISGQIRWRPLIWVQIRSFCSKKTWSEAKRPDLTTDLKADQVPLFCPEAKRPGLNPKRPDLTTDLRQKNLISTLIWIQIRCHVSDVDLRGTISRISKGKPIV